MAYRRSRAAFNRKSFLRLFKFFFNAVVQCLIANFIDLSLELYCHEEEFSPVRDFASGPGSTADARLPKLLVAVQFGRLLPLRFGDLR